MFFVFVCFYKLSVSNVSVDVQPLRDTEDERLMCEVEFFWEVYIFKEGTSNLYFRDFGRVT